MPQAQRGVEIVGSFRGQWWALPLTDEVGVWDVSNCGMPGRELLLVDEAQLVVFNAMRFLDSVSLDMPLVLNC